MENTSKKIKYAVAQALTQILWVKGLLSDNEKKKVEDKNKSTFLSDK